MDNNGGCPTVPTRIIMFRSTLCSSNLNTIGIYPVVGNLVRFAMVLQPRTESHMHSLWTKALPFPLMKWFIAAAAAAAFIPIQNSTERAPCMSRLLLLGTVDRLSTRYAEIHESQRPNFLHEKKPLLLKQCLVAWWFMQLCSRFLRQISMVSLTHFSSWKILLALIRRLGLLVGQTYEMIKMYLITFQIY